MKYKVGDVVRVFNPTSESTEWLFWADQMDEFNGIETEVVEILEYQDEPPRYILAGCEDWNFAAEWLEPVDQLPGQMSVEDFGLVVS